MNKFSWIKLDLSNKSSYPEDNREIILIDTVGKTKGISELSSVITKIFIGWVDEEKETLVIQTPEGDILLWYEQLFYFTHYTYLEDIKESIKIE